MRDHSKAYQFTSEELQTARMQIQETKEAIQRLKNFIDKTAYLSGDAVALQRASALKTIHHLETQIADWIRRYPQLAV